jgi:outer membrane protein
MSKLVQQVLLAMLIIAVSFLFYLQYSAPPLVFVNSSKLLSEYKGMIDARQVYQQKATSWKANIDTLAVEVEKSIKDYEKESTKMTDKEKELSRELIRTKQKQLADYQRAIQDKAGQEDSQMTQKVLEQVNTYIKKYGETHSYRIILAATDYGNIAYAQEGLDITEEIIEGLNKQYAGQ